MYYRKQLELKEKLILSNTEPWQEQIANIALDRSDTAKEKTSLKSSGSDLKLVGGLDITMADGDDINGCLCLVVLSYPELEVSRNNWRFTGKL